MAVPQAAISKPPPPSRSTKRARLVAAEFRPLYDALPRVDRPRFQRHAVA